MVVFLTHAHTHTNAAFHWFSLMSCMIEEHKWHTSCHKCMILSHTHSYGMCIDLYIQLTTWLIDAPFVQGDGDWFQCLAMWWFCCPRTVGVTQFTCDMHGCLVVFAMSQWFHCNSLFLQFKWFKCVLLLRSAKQTPILNTLPGETGTYPISVNQDVTPKIIRYPARNKWGCGDLSSSTFETW